MALEAARCGSHPDIIVRRPLAPSLSALALAFATSLAPTAACADGFGFIRPVIDESAASGGADTRHARPNHDVSPFGVDPFLQEQRPHRFTTSTGTLP